MKLEFAFLITTLFITGSLEADDCKNLIEKTSVHLETQLPDLITTGDNLKFKLIAKVENPNLLDPLGGFVPLYIHLGNNLTGSKTLFDGLPLSKKSLEEGKGSLEKTVDWKIPENFSGEYTLYVRLLIGGACTHTFAFPKKISTFIHAKNPAMIDIAPPVVRDVRFDKKIYVPDSKVAVTIEAVDQNPICTREAKEEGRTCSGSWHIAFRDKAGKYHNVYPEARRGLKPQTYFAEFELPVELTAGEYTAEVYDVADIWDNYIHQSAPSLARVVTVEK